MAIYINKCRDVCASKSSDKRLKRAFERTKPGKAFARTMPKAPEISRIKKEKTQPPRTTKSSTTPIKHSFDQKAVLSADFSAGLPQQRFKH